MLGWISIVNGLVAPGCQRPDPACVGVLELLEPQLLHQLRDGERGRSCRLSWSPIGEQRSSDDVLDNVLCLQPETGV